MAKTATLDEIGQQTRVTSNIYKIPVWKISFLQCLEGHAQGEEASYYLCEGGSSLEAALKLIEFPAYWENYNKLSLEQRKRIREPFKLRFNVEAEKIPACIERHKTKRGDYVCGPPMKDLEYDIHGINGEFGDCMCQSFWTHNPDDLRACCPYKQILQTHY